jgi:hypothetical protein
MLQCRRWSTPKLALGVEISARAHPILEYDPAGGHFLIFGGLGHIRNNGQYEQRDYKADFHRIQIGLAKRGVETGAFG